IIIFVLIITPFFVSAEETISINKFELIWSSDTYTPFDYQGRNLPVIGSKITVNAILNVSGGDIRNLKYSWFLEDIFQQNKSGYGKNEFYFYAQKRPGSYHTIRLQIFNEDRTVFEEKIIQIPVTKPELLIYSSNGNSHFLNQASKISAVLAGKTFSFIAKPYFFSISKLTDLIFEWTINRQQPIISSDYNASVLHLDVPLEAKSTENEILVNVKNSTAEEQKAYQTIKINIY
ncbi:MAG: hypothetical protein Q8N88_02775, partial [Nanoarchaeota archaeon]|nr:hypothetical protein [Nanoarchaeota archaeon]